MGLQTGRTIDCDHIDLNEENAAQTIRFNPLRKIYSNKIAPPNARPINIENIHQDFINKSAIREIGTNV